MRKILPVFAGLLAACSTPAYRAPEVPVPATYSVTSVSPVTADSRGASEDIPTSAIHVSTALASAPFWSDLGDSTLTMLIREASAPTRMFELPSRVLRAPVRHGASRRTIWCRR